jgi:hypothetical protein
MVFLSLFSLYRIMDMAGSHWLLVAFSLERASQSILSNTLSLSKMTFLLLS